MPKVTALAFLFLNDGVDILHPKVFICKFLVALEAILTRKPRFATCGFPPPKGPAPGGRSLCTRIQQNPTEKDEHP